MTGFEHTCVDVDVCWVHRVMPGALTRVSLEPEYPLSKHQSILVAQDITSQATLETTQGQIDGFFSQPLFKCYLPEVASVGI